MYTYVITSVLFCSFYGSFLKLSRPPHLMASLGSDQPPLFQCVVEGSGQHGHWHCDKGPSHEQRASERNDDTQESCLKYYDCWTPNLHRVSRRIVRVLPRLVGY